MPKTRGNAKTAPDASSEQHSKTSSTSAEVKGHKRKSPPTEGENVDHGKRNHNGTTHSALKGGKKKQKVKDDLDEEKVEKRPQKPRLTTPDLEFDYDRTQLRDPRPTPGRKARPRWTEFDAPQEVKDWVESTFEVIKPEKPKGRLNWMQKDELFGDEVRMNPFKNFHNLYKCHDKGRDGSPTYDNGGFELDWEKVDEWMKPKPYNKRKMVRGMESEVDKQVREEKEMFELFFAESFTDAKADKMRVKDFVKDHVSKDLGIPWDQIGPKQVKMWRDKGFEPVKYEEWWKEPTAEENRRFLKMLSGASLRKRL